MKQARPTTYKGTPMRSRLEAGFAAWLDEMELKWAYEPQCFASERGQYLPDFRIDDLMIVAHGRQTVYVEVKPAGWSDRPLVENQFPVIWQTDPHALCVLVQEGNPVLVYNQTWGRHFLRASWVLWSTEPFEVALAGRVLDPWSAEYWAVNKTSPTRA